MNARRTLFGFALVALLASHATAAEISTDDAARAASAWVDRGYAMGKLPAGRTVVGVDDVGDPATGARLRVVRFEGGGYVVLSADDLVDPVLAFSETGDGLDLDENNPFWTLLRGDIAAREAAAGVVRGAPAPAAAGGEGKGGAPAAATAAPTAAQRKWAALLAGGEKPAEGTGVSVDDESHALQSISDVRVDSFVDSRWNQKTASAYSGTTDYCYNYYTPNHYYSGCVATAISQMMWYFRHPTASVAASTYPCQVDSVATNATMMGGVYDWANMPAQPWVSGTTEAQRAAIGKLVYDVGVTVGMNWKSGSSSASIFVGQTALKTDFGYAQAVALSYQNDSPYDYYPWSLDRFKQVVIPCLDARTPVGLSISRPSGGGHAVFADGYGYSSGDFYLHVNFGWGYSRDTQTAWYCPPDLNTNNYDYDTIKGILCNIFPDRTGNIFSGRVTGTDGSPVANATVTFSDGQTTTTDANGIYAFVAQPGSYTATATKGGASQSVSGSLTETVALRTIDRTTSYSYTRNKCGNSGGNDIVLNVSHDTAPTIASASATDVSFTSAKIVVAVSDLGAGSSSVEVKVVVGGTTRTQTLNASGTATLTFTGLSDGTPYTAAVTATGSNGLPSTGSVAFTTTAYTAPTLGTATVSDVTQTGATVSVPVTGLGAGSAYATVRIAVDGVERTATVSAAGGVATAVFSGLAAETGYTASIVATGSNGKSATSSATFTTASLVFTGWFDVRWAEQPWGIGADWLTASGQSAAGGRFAVPAGDASSLAGGLLALALPEGGELRFTASEPSAAGGTVKVQGTLVPVKAATPDPAAGAIAGLVFTSSGYKGWDGTRWVALSGAVPSASATDWVATFDFTGSPAKVRYAVGGTVLVADGTAWIPLATSQRYLRGLGYAGGGSVGNFKATRSGGLEVPVLATPEVDGLVPLSFGKDSSNNPTFEVTVRNAAKDAWYTVYAADAVDGTYRAVTSEKATVDGLKTLSIPAPSSKPTRFVRIGVSDAQIPANTEL